MPDTVTGSILGFFAASVPGIIVALLSDFLANRREERRQKQRETNARGLLQREFEGNRNALKQFWDTINGLDGEKQTQSEQHLAGMAQHGLFSYSLPRWESTRWNGMDSDLLGALNPKDLAAYDQFYRDLEAITDAYTKMTVLSSQEMDLYNRERFWYNRYGGDYGPNFERLRGIVERELR
jgi:hypothetical protein